MTISMMLFVSPNLVLPYSIDIIPVTTPQIIIIPSRENILKNIWIDANFIFLFLALLFENGVNPQKNKLMSLLETVA
jgi:hypothetical protein